MDPIELYDVETYQFPSSGALCKHIQVVSEGIDYLCLWLDCDKEGENICFEVIENCKKNLPKNSEDYIFRAKFSSLVASDIKIAFENIKNKPNINESNSVNARQILDLKIGVSFSRYQSQELLRRFPELK